MSLEEIETKVAGILQEEVIINLKSSVWKERLEGEEKLFSCLSATFSLTIFFILIILSMS